MIWLKQQILFSLNSLHSHKICCQFTFYVIIIIFTEFLFTIVNYAIIIRFTFPLSYIKTVQRVPCTENSLFCYIIILHYFLLSKEIDEIVWRSQVFSIHLRSIQTKRANESERKKVTLLIDSAMNQMNQTTDANATAIQH